MRPFICLILLFLAGCDFSYYERQQTIYKGRVDWDRPDIGNLRRALDACSVVGPEMDTACASRLEETKTLIAAVKSCHLSTLPACHEVLRRLEWRPFNGLDQLTEQFSAEWIEGIPAENLDALKPQNKFIWSAWGWEDVWAVSTDRIIGHRPVILTVLYTSIVALMAYLGWLFHYDKKQQQKRRLEAVEQAAKEKLEVDQRLAEATRLEQERLAEQVRQQQEADRMRAEHEARLELQRQLMREAKLEEEREKQKIAEEHEHAKNALDNTLKDVTTKTTQRKNSRWSTVKRGQPSQSGAGDI